jgi:ADP-ribosyl-[dinitrogen reductase] hydrolase
MGHQHQPAITESTPSAQLPISTELAQELLNTIETLLQEGGRLLMKEFKRPEGPRGSGGHANVDEEVEAVMRDHLDETFPDHGVCGEELGHRDRAPRSDTPFLWLLDPNDGTKSYLKGFRGSSVSVGLLYNNEPIAGRVFAFGYPNDQGDLIMGGIPEYFGGVTRNGEPCARPAPVTDPKQSFIALSQGADNCSTVNMELVSPSRFIAIPSIAYRLSG